MISVHDGNSLVVNKGPPLATANSFRVFSASAYAGAFWYITLETGLDAANAHQRAVVGLMANCVDVMESESPDRLSFLRDRDSRRCFSAESGDSEVQVEGTSTRPISGSLAFFFDKCPCSLIGLRTHLPAKVVAGSQQDRINPIFDSTEFLFGAALKKPE